MWEFLHATFFLFRNAQYVLELVGISWDNSVKLGLEINLKLFHDVSSLTCLEARSEVIMQSAGVPNSFNLMIITAIKTKATVCNKKYTCCKKTEQD